MCKLSNLYVIDLFDNTESGGIEWNVANRVPQLMNQPCKIVVKQMQMQLKDDVTNLQAQKLLRVIHNINIQSGTNYQSFSNPNTLAFIDSFQGRLTDTTGDGMTGFTTSDCVLFAPNGLPAILKLNRVGGTSIIDVVNLSWAIRLEITVNPQED